MNLRLSVSSVHGLRKLKGRSTDWPKAPWPIKHPWHFSRTNIWTNTYQTGNPIACYLTTCLQQRIALSFWRHPWKILSRPFSKDSPSTVLHCVATSWNQGEVMSFWSHRVQFEEFRINFAGALLSSSNLVLALPNSHSIGPFISFSDIRQGQTLL